MKRIYKIMIMIILIIAIVNIYKSNMELRKEFLSWCEVNGYNANLESNYLEFCELKGIINI